MVNSVQSIFLGSSDFGLNQAERIKVFKEAKTEKYAWSFADQNHAFFQIYMIFHEQLQNCNFHVKYITVFTLGEKFVVKVLGSYAKIIWRTLIFSCAMRHNNNSRNIGK